MDETREQSKAGVYVTRLFDWADRRGLYARPVVAFLTGAILSLSFAPTNLFFVLFIAVPFMIVLIDRAGSARQAFSLGWWLGFGLFAVGLHWIGNSFTQQDAVPAILAPFAVLALSAVLALYPALAFWIAKKLWMRGFPRVVLFAAIWTLLEIVRGIWFTGFPWHVLGSAWAEWLWMAQSVYWLSVYGLTFVTLVCCGAWVSLLERSALRATVFKVGLPGLALVMLAVVGQNRLGTTETRYHLGVSMRLVQANVQQREKWISYLIEDHFDKHMSLSRASDPEGKAKGVRLLIWPETAVQRENFDREGSLHRWRISKLLEYGSFAVTGAPRYRRTDDGYQYFNSLFAVNSDADLYARYDKVHLVPFGEYLPFADVLGSLGLAQLVPGAAFSAGNNLTTIRLPGIPGFSPLICYEAIFPGQVIHPRNRPEWLLNISNDAWFGYSSGPYQHLALSRLRAIEEGLPLVRSTPTGVTAVIDGLGRTLNSMPIGRTGTLDSPLPKSVAAPSVPTGAKIIFLAFLCGGIIFLRLLAGWWAMRRSA